MEREKNKLYEDLQGALSLLLLLESNLSQQRQDEVYLRTVRIIRNFIASALSEIATDQ